MSETPTPEGMVDRVAKIIDPVAFGGYPDEAIDPTHGSTWAQTRFAMRERARGILASLRDLTPAADAAVWAAMHVEGGDREKQVERVGNWFIGHTAWIDAALTEPE